MRETVAPSQCVSITLRYLDSGNAFGRREIHNSCVSVHWNYCAGDVPAARQQNERFAVTFTDYSAFFAQYTVYAYVVIQTSFD